MPPQTAAINRRTSNSTNVIILIFKSGYFHPLYFFCATKLVPANYVDPKTIINFTGVLVAWHGRMNSIE
jgi:hypothetical protein